jgi:DNA/RNA-binding domain of Phe-tRNA-synthetase-like protein
MPVSVAVDGDVFVAHPEYVALIVLAEGIGNGPSDDGTSAVLDAAEQHLRARRLTRPAANPHIAARRAALSAFGAKPSKYPSSAEALAARVVKGATLPRVNVLVDVYNAVSVRALTPVGGEDLDHLHGAPRLTIANGDEPFDGHDGAPRLGEIVWRDDAGVTCRRWNWRQGPTHAADRRDDPRVLRLRPASRARREPARRRRLAAGVAAEGALAPLHHPAHSAGPRPASVMGPLVSESCPKPTCATASNP